jgi:hypothetical protein
MDRTLKSSGWVFVALVGFALSFAAGAASPPGRINYQGVLRDAAGKPVSGATTISFLFYDDPAAGTLLWEEIYDPTVYPPQVTVSGGLFSVALGDPAHRHFGSEALFPGVFVNHASVYLAIKVAADPEMTPRVKVASSAYALNCDTLDGLDSAAFATASHPHSGADITSGTVSEGRIDALIARDAEIMPTVLANDGTGSTLDADLLDGQQASAFSLTGHNHTGVYLPLAGGTMAGNIAFSGTQTVDGFDISASAPNWNSAYTHSTLTSNVHGLTYTAEGAGGGLDADLLDGSHESAFFNLSQDETVTGRPAFNYNSGSPFTVLNSTYVKYLNADMLDGHHSTDFMVSGTDDWVNTTGDTMTGSLQLNPTTAKGIIGVAALSTTYNVIDVENTGSGIPILGTTHYSAPFLSIGYGVKGVADGSSALGGNRGVYGQASAAFSNMGVQGFATGNVGTKYGLSAFADGLGVNYGGYISATGTTATENYGIKASASGATGTGSKNYAGYFDGNTTTGSINYAGYFDGNVGIVDGKLTAAASTASFAGFNLPQGTAPASPADGDLWTTTTGVYARISGVTVGPLSSTSIDHGSLLGLGDDDHPQYFNLSQNETVTGIPAFNGGTNGVSAPFTVDSYTTVANLSADWLDGYSEAAFFRLAQDETVTGTTTFTAATTDIRGEIVDGDSAYVTIGEDAYVSGGHLGVGTTPIADTGVLTIVNSSAASTLFGVSSQVTSTEVGATDPSIYGAYFTAAHNGALNNSQVLGSYGLADGASDSTGSHYGALGYAQGGEGTHYGVYGLATEGNGTHYGVYGRAVTAAGATGIHYGVYGYATGGATNWGLYTPHNAYVGWSLGIGTGTTVLTYDLQLAADSAAKPGTNTWTIASDERLKKDIRPFADGLETLRGIRPIRYTYNGLAGTPKDLEGIGVIAQEIRKVAPYTVGTFRAKLDEKDESATELYDFNSHALTFVMINAIKELDARTGGGVANLEKPDGGLTRAAGSPPGSETAVMGASGHEVAPSDPAAAGVLPFEELAVAEPVDEGDVLVIIPQNGEELYRCHFSSDPAVIGIAGGTSRAERNGSRLMARVRFSGVALCKVDATAAPILRGDLLATSATPGHAMKAINAGIGTVIGKALEPLESGTGLIKVMVMLR